MACCAKPKRMNETLATAIASPPRPAARVVSAAAGSDDGALAGGVGASGSKLRWLMVFCRASPGTARVVTEAGLRGQLPSGSNPARRLLRAMFARRRLDAAPEGGVAAGHLGAVRGARRARGGRHLEILARGDP